MTIEETKKYNDWTKSEIIDDFESRVCENCKHWYSPSKDRQHGLCEGISGGTKGWELGTPAHFGCTKFIKGKHEI